MITLEHRWNRSIRKDYDDPWAWVIRSRQTLRIRRRGIKCLHLIKKNGSSGFRVANRGDADREKKSVHASRASARTGRRNWYFKCVAVRPEPIEGRMAIFSHDHRVRRVRRFFYQRARLCALCAAAVPSPTTSLLAVRPGKI